jgi:hypothetical protein
LAVPRDEVLEALAVPVAAYQPDRSPEALALVLVGDTAPERMGHRRPGRDHQAQDRRCGNCCEKFDSVTLKDVGHVTITFHPKFASHPHKEPT